MKILFRLPLRPFLPPPAKSSGKKVLLVRDDVIGDLIVPTSAVIKWLTEQGCDVYLVLRENLMDIGRLLLPEAKLLPIDIKLYRQALKYRFSILKNIRRIGFDTAIGSTIHSSVNDDIVRSSGAKERWGYKRSNKLKEIFRLRGIKKSLTLLNIDYSARQYSSVLEHERHFLEDIFQAEIDQNAFGPAVTIPPSAASPAEAGYIHYLAEAGDLMRVYQPDRLLPILLSIGRKAGLKVVITGLKKMECTDEFCVNLTGKTTLAEVIATAAQADFVIGNESGLVHMAWIIGRKTAMFLGGGHWGMFRPAPDVLLLNHDCEYRCCDWKCKFDMRPVPCVNLDEAEVRAKLESFILK